MSLPDIAAIVGSILSAIGLIGGGIGLLLTARQLRLAHKTARGEFLIHLDGMFRKHDKVHRLLQHDKAWPAPTDKEAMVDIVLYMALFELVKALIDDGILDAATFNRLYGYRVTFLIKNEVVKNRILENPPVRRGWQAFVELAELLGRHEAAVSPPEGTVTNK